MSLRRHGGTSAKESHSIFSYPCDQPLVHVQRPCATGEGWGEYLQNRYRDFMAEKHDFRIDTGFIYSKWKEALNRHLNLHRVQVFQLRQKQIDTMFLKVIKNIIDEYPSVLGSLVAKYNSEVRFAARSNYAEGINKGDEVVLWRFGTPAETIYSELDKNKKVILHQAYLNGIQTSNPPLRLTLYNFKE